MFSVPTLSMNIQSIMKGCFGQWSTPCRMQYVQVYQMDIKVFNGLRVKNVVSWSIVITRYE